MLLFGGNNSSVLVHVHQEQNPNYHLPHADRGCQETAFHNNNVDYMNAGRDYQAAYNWIVNHPPATVLPTPSGNVKIPFDYQGLIEMRLIRSCKPDKPLPSDNTTLIWTLAPRQTTNEPKHFKGTSALMTTDKTKPNRQWMS
ncbi:MAG: hypothetical protein M2R45_03665 [Verrucomicrobia subdivision 3 bacterium]|nr:hypothetical protein [Limisphaerales bacterium]MCS1412706.1 hypothetical protein [Limisphaerales bacterium]